MDVSRYAVPVTTSCQDDPQVNSIVT